MSRFHVCIAVCGLLAAGGPASASSGASLTGRVRGFLASVLRPGLGQIDAEIGRIHAELKELPPLSLGNSGVRQGYHGTYTPIPDKPFWIVIDLGKAYPIDAVALVPAEGNSWSPFGSGYGFPRRFRIDVSNDLAFEDSVTIASEVETPFPNPGPYPYFVEAGGVRARYVRLFAIQRWRQEDRIWMVAMGEIFVVSGGTNVAAGAAVYPRNRLSVRRPPVWMDENLVDNQSALGMPITNERSQTHGYCSRTEHTSAAVKWVQVDLGKPMAIDEVRLAPAHPQDNPTPGYGFPLRFRVEAANEPRFSKPVVLADYTGEDFLNPGDNLVSIRCEGNRARYVRVTATRLYDAKSDTNGFPDRRIFALAELEVFSGGKNVALGAPVQALDSLEIPRSDQLARMYPEGPTWAPRFLVDGYNSRYRLTGLEPWLRGLSERGKIERRLSVLTARRAALQEKIQTVNALAGAGLALLLGGGLIFVTVSSRRKRERQLRDLRGRLARDLHDDIGSSLGSIRLTSQIAQTAKDAPETVLGDLRNIETVASAAADSMRDIIWLLDVGSASSGELVNQMRLIAQRLLAEREFTLEVRHGMAKELSLEFRRNVLLAFKEALYNAARYSGASHIRIEIDGQTKYFEFRVQDNGCGFDTASAEQGHGLENIRVRAEVLRGKATIKSASSEGTSVDFRVPVA